MTHSHVCQRLSGALDILCPMHLCVSPTGHIRHVGPTLQKLRPDLTWSNMRFLEVFDLQRPRNITTMQQVLAINALKLHMKFRDRPRTTLQGIVVDMPQGDGAIINLSFGISILDAVGDYKLTSSDFAATDMAIEMLYLVEAKSAAMEASRTLNHRLQTAKIAAEEQAFTDTLTGLKNRRAVDHVLPRVIEAGRGFALMQLDLDFFKPVNDSMGHAAGDYVLQQVAKILTEETRQDDDVVRIGGDEFVLIFQGDIPKEKLITLAERIITRIKEPITFQGKDIQVSASIGITTGRGRGAAPEHILNEADLALYACKDNGRGQFAFFTPSMKRTAPHQVLG